MSDFFAFEDRLIARLKPLVDEPGLKWFTADDPTEAEKRAQYAPAVHIVYGGHKPTGNATGRLQQIEQTWIVILSVKSARQRDAASDRRERVGERMGQVLRALLGWPRARSDEQFGPLRLVPAGGVRRLGNVAHYPLAFATTTHVEGEP